MANDIRQWLGELGLERYADTFAEHEIDLDTIGYITDQDFADLGVALGARRKLIAAAQQLITQPAERTEVERRQLTLLFCDLVGSTELSQRVDPEELREVMTSYQDVVVGAITQHGGHVANYLGDGILAYFGWPQANEDQAAQAVRAGLAAVAGVTSVTAGAGRALESRVGIATGTVIVGDLVGERGRDVDAVIGETPNLAARLEGLAASGQVVIEAATYELLGQRFDVDDLGPQPLKGFTMPVQAYAVVGERTVASRFEQARSGAFASMVGRESERQLFRNLWDRTRSGAGQVVVVTGDAGIGKSRLVREFRADLHTVRQASWRLQCSPMHTNTAYHPIAQRLERAAGFAASDSASERLDKLERLLNASGAASRDDIALIAHLVSVETQAGDVISARTPPELRSQTSRALVDQVLSQCQHGPLLITIEDMHWIDPTSEAVIGDLVDRISDQPVLLVVTHRPGYQPKFATSPLCTTITLNRLGREHCAAIVRAISGDEPAAGTIDTIVARSDGNPLYVEELTRTAVKHGAGSASIPVSLEASLMARLDQLGSAKEVAQVASVVGREFTADLVAAVINAEPASLDAHFAALSDLGVVDASDGSPTGSYVFRHALVQEAAYATMLQKRQRELHLRLGEQLETGAFTSDLSGPEVLGRHFAQADVPERAAVHFARAGRDAAARYANDEAISHFEHALELLPGTDESARSEFSIRIALGVALIAAHGYAAASVEENYRRAQAIEDPAATPTERFAVARGLWNCYFDRGDLERSLRLANDLVDLAEGVDDDLMASFAARALGSVQLMRGDVARSTALLESGRSARERWQGRLDLQAFGEDPGVICEMYLGWTKTAQGDIEAGLACSKDAADRARRAGQPIGVAFADTLRVVALAWAGYLQQAHLLALELEAFARENHLVFWGASARAYVGWTLPENADPDERIGMMVDGFAAWKRTGAELHAPTFERIIMEGRLVAGDIVGARRTGRAALHACDRYGENLHRPDILRLMASCEESDGDLAAAEVRLREAIDGARQAGAGLFELRAAAALLRLLSRQGRRGEGLLALHEASQRVESPSAAPVVVAARQLLEPSG